MDVLVLTADLSNAAWRNDNDEVDTQAVAEGLRRAADLLEAGFTAAGITDTNGNPCGMWEITYGK